MRTSEEASQDSALLLAAIEKGVERYFAECRARVPAFVKRHFRYPGAWYTNRQSLGWDMLRSPLNLLWVPVYLLAQCLAWLAQRLGLAWPTRWLRRVPSGMRTRVQRYLIERTEAELLGRAAGVNPLREAIAEAIVETQGLGQLSEEREAQLEKSLVDALSQYALTRTANADISNTVFATVAGAFTLQKFTPGGIAIGMSLAGLLANRLAALDFIFGPWLGRWYYALFPVSPDAGLVLVSTAGVMLLMAVFACFSGLVSDPLQSLTGIHQRRLKRMIDSLECDLKARTTGSFRPKDAYLARLMDIVDAARVGLA